MSEESLRVSLKEFLEARLAAVDQRYSERILAMDRAIDVAWQNSEKWRLNANEWRAAMDDRESRFATKVEIDNLVKAMDEMRSRLDRSEGRGGGINAAWSIVILVAMLALVALQVYLKI